MKRIISLLILLLVVNVLFAQEMKKDHLPEEQINVNKEYDDSGNLTRYDSTYVKKWSLDTTMIRDDRDTVRKEMEAIFGIRSQWGNADSVQYGSDPFSELHDQFLQRQQDFFNQFDQGISDSILVSPQDFLHSIPDFDRLREEMMNQFGQFFQNDSDMLWFKEIPDQEDFEFLNDPSEFDHLRKKFEQHFEQLAPNDIIPEKMGTSSSRNTIGRIQQD